MKKTFSIDVPTTWKDVNLKSYLGLQKDLETYKDNEDVHTDLMIHHLCGINLDNIQGISIDSYNNIKEKFYKLEKPEDMPLQHFVTIDGVEYGFEPNLSQMSYGAYVDISQFENLTIDKNWTKIMNILYRPVIRKQGDLYQIKAYDGKGDSDIWLNVSMDVHFGALFFFYRFMEGLTPRYPELFEGNGNTTQHQINFGKKWKGYSSIYELAGGDIKKMEEVTLLPLEQCLLYLSFVADKQLLEELMHKEAMKGLK